MTGRTYAGGFWDINSILYLDLGARNTGCSVFKNSLDVHLKSNVYKNNCYPIIWRQIMGCFSRLVEKPSGELSHVPFPTAALL